MHAIFSDGIYLQEEGVAKPGFERVSAPTLADIHIFPNKSIKTCGLFIESNPTLARAIFNSCSAKNTTYQPGRGQWL